MTAIDIGAGIAALLAGAALGIVYFTMLRRAVRRLATPEASFAAVIPYLLRLPLAAGGFWLIAQAGAAPLLAALAGFVAARHAMQRRAERDA